MGLDKILASMLLNYTQQSFSVWILGIQSHSPVSKSRVAVAIPVRDGQLTILDPACRYWTHTANHSGIGAKEVTVAIENWLSHLEDEVPNASVYAVFSVHYYQEFSSTQEFIEWVTKLT